jgi:eukaryotic-like serine/threonine-protein kinase
MLEEDNRVSEFADLLRVARKAAGLTQEELAERSGLSVRGISDLERGSRRTPRRDTFDLLAQALNLTAKQRKDWELARRPQSPNQSWPQDSKVPLPALIGRAVEISALRAGLESALQENSQVILVAGEPGIGKTRLAEEIARYANARGYISCWGRCFHGAGASAFWPWIHALRALIEHLEPEQVRDLIDNRTIELIHMLPELRTILADRAHSGTANDSSALQMMDSVSVLLQRLSRSRPLLIILDDLHWADHSSHLLLEFLAKTAPNGRFAILGLYRDTEIDNAHPLASAVLEVRRRSASRHLTLSGLDLQGVEEMVLSLMPASQKTNLAVQLTERTAGNPFFVGEMVQHLERVSNQESGGVGLLPELGVPAGVQELIRQRLGLLSSDCLDLLRIASAVGRVFDLRLLESVSNLPPTVILDLVDEAERAGLVSTEANVMICWRFVHDLIRETIYDELRPSQRVSLHLKIGQSMESSANDAMDPNFAIIAQHFRLAIPSVDHRPAIEYLRKASKQAMTRIAYESAVQHLSDAAGLLERTGELESDQGADVLLELGVALMRAGKIPTARHTFSSIAEIARRHGLPEHFARAAIGFSGGFVLLGREDREACDLLSEACTILGQEQTSLRAQCLARLSLLLVSEDDTSIASRRAKVSREAVMLARMVDDLEAEALALHCQHRDLWLTEPNDPRESRAAGNKMVEVAKASGNAELIFTGLCWQMFEPLALGEGETVRSLLQECSELGSALRQPFHT